AISHFGGFPEPRYRKFQVLPDQTCTVARAEPTHCSNAAVFGSLGQPIGRLLRISRTSFKRSCRIVVAERFLHLHVTVLRRAAQIGHELRAVLWKPAHSGKIVNAQGPLGIGIPLVCGFLIPDNRLGLVFRDPLPPREQLPDAILRLSVSLLREGTPIL